jgi:hypothetical protein
MAPVFSKEVLNAANKTRTTNSCTDGCFSKLAIGSLHHKLCTINEPGEDYVESIGRKILKENVRTSMKNSKKVFTSTKQHVTVKHEDRFYDNNGMEEGVDVEYCRSCFEYLYDMSTRTYDRYKSLAKDIEILSARVDMHYEKFGLEKRKRKVSDVEKDAKFGNLLEARAFYAECIRKGIAECEILDDSDLRLLCIPSTVQARECYWFLEKFFDINCDKAPNSYDGTCELPSSIYSKDGIFKIYQYHCSLHEGEDCEPLSKSQFEIMWANLYPNVRITKYVSVAGKCSICAEIYAMQEKCRSTEQFERIKLFASYHRASVTEQRMAYYERRTKAQEHKELFMCMIVDGMQQNHTKLPYFANQKTSSSLVTVHVQGAKVHGQSKSFYLTLPHIDNGFNVNAEVIISEIAARVEKCESDGSCFPRILYIQIDGGAENTAKAMFGLCETLVDNDLFDMIELNRLPVGHTHEDIDALFGTIWTHLRDKTILSIDEFEELLKESFKTKTSIFKKKKN